MTRGTCDPAGSGKPPPASRWVGLGPLDLVRRRLRRSFRGAGWMRFPTAPTHG